ncbi:MAG: virulence factor SrfC family protein [Pseudomonadota bacterium]
MSDPSQQKLLEAALSLGSASSRGRAWATRMAEVATSVATQKHSLVDATRRTENLSRKLAASSSRRNSAGVFGPSQAGKSYLVSVLGRSKDKPLMVDFAGTMKNFIMEINPEGGKESTGLVTRFTIVPGTRDAKHPVELRLLTETDLVKIIGNSFLSDFDEHSRKLGLPSEDRIRAVIAQLEPQARQTAAHLDEIVMYDVGEYFESNFRKSVEQLRRAGYWEALTRFGHRLPVAARIELYSLLWGESPDITGIFKLLQRSLEDLSHSPTARASIDCLVPRARSIIDVEILKQHLGTPEDLKDLISVVPELPDGSDGPAIKVPRATLTALVAEIKVVMADKPWTFFEHTDLLDFPGARSREKMLELPTDPEERSFCVRNMLLRGKIAYLFQRYTEERELTCMLLCMPPSNQEVKDLTQLVSKWVEQTHGGNAQMRAQLPCALFFVLTKFDMELTTKPGDTPESWVSRVDTRLEASMFQLYKQQDWLQNWDGKAFCNTFFLRNPGFEIDSVFQYEALVEEGTPRRETGIAVQAASRIDANRQGMLASENCVKHFSNPALAWDSAMTFNDGGVRFLVENLERVLSPKLKTMQMMGRLVDQARQLDGNFKGFYHAEGEASRKEKEEALNNLRRRLFQACKARQLANFSGLLACFQLSDADVRATFLNVANMKVELTVEPATAPGQAEADPWDDPWADSTAAAASSAKALPVKVRDRPYQFALQVLNLWTEQIRGLSADPVTLAALGLDSQLVSELGNELVVAADRLGLIDRIAGQVRSQLVSANVRWDEVADRGASIATVIVNDFVAFLGFGDMAETVRPAVPEGPKPRERGVFAAPAVPAAGVLPTLGTQRTEWEKGYFLDWGVALRQLGIDNMAHAGGREISEEDNRALGDILQKIAPALQLATS